MKTLIAICLLAVVALAQPVPQDRYLVTANTTKLTLQQPATNARQITFGDTDNPGVSVYCAAASTITFSWNGTAASTTAGSELKLPGTFQPSGMTVWTASNVGSGTTGPVYNVAAAGTMAFSLTWFKFGTQGTATNLTVATSNSCTITFAYSAI